jgi:hypothetical protein
MTENHDDKSNITTLEWTVLFVYLPFSVSYFTWEILDLFFDFYRHRHLFQLGGLIYMFWLYLICISSAGWCEKRNINIPVMSKPD